MPTWGWPMGWRFHSKSDSSDCWRRNMRLWLQRFPLVTRRPRALLKEFNPNSEIGSHDLTQSLGGKAFCRSSTYHFRYALLLRKAYPLPPSPRLRRTGPPSLKLRGTGKDLAPSHGFEFRSSGLTIAPFPLAN